MSVKIIGAPEKVSVKVVDKSGQDIIMLAKLSQTELERVLTAVFKSRKEPAAEASYLDLVKTAEQFPRVKTAIEKAYQTYKNEVKKS